MNTIIDQLSAYVQEAFSACGFDRELGTVTVSNRPDMCQFQCNGALQGAKIFRQAPIRIAAAVAAKLQDCPAFRKVETAPPGFINLTLDGGFLSEYLNAVSKDERAGMPQLLEGKRILVDYGGPNVAKPLHVGHLRSAIIGEAIKRIARAAGADAAGDIHLGDWGLQMGLVITELRFRHPDWRCFSPDFDPEKDVIGEISLEELNEVYPCASAKSKTDPEYSAAAHEATVLLQKKTPGYYALWKSFMKTSISDMKRIYDRLGVSFEYWYGESDAEDYIPRLLKLLEEKRLLEESDGALIVRVEKETDDAPMPPVLIKKSDGSNIYATTDLATIMQREQFFGPDGIWYVVDKRQGLHFTQVFRCAKKAGLIADEGVCEHLGFGTMNGPDGKPFKTRDGGVMHLTDLLDRAKEGALEKLDSSKFSDEQTRLSTADKLSIASVKFGDLINNRQKDCVFDFDRFLSAEGKTGAYLLYSVTRIGSLLEKSEEEPPETFDPSCPLSPAETDLMLTLASTGEYFRSAVLERCPNYIAEAAYRIASSFSGFYHDVRILSEEDAAKRRNRLALCALTKKTMRFLLRLLAIETVDVM